MHTYRRGKVTVDSAVPPAPTMWWDYPLLHPIWSYASWISMILKEYGHPGMRSYLKGRGWWDRKGTVGSLNYGSGTATYPEGTKHARAEDRASA